MFLVRSVYFNLRNILPKSDTFLPGHPVYVDIHEGCLLLLSILKTKDLVGRRSSKFSKYDFPKIRRLGAELLYTDGRRTDCWKGRET